MMDAGLSGKVATADTKAYSGAARGSGTGTTSSSKGGFFDELSKASSQKTASADDEDTAIDADGQDPSELLADDGTAAELSEDGAGTVKTGGKVKPIIDISAAGLRKAADQSVSEVALNQAADGVAEVVTPDGDTVTTDLATAAQGDKTQQAAKAALGALSDGTVTLTADESASLQQAAKAGLASAGSSEKLPVDAEEVEEAEDGSTDAAASDEDLEAVLSLLGGNTAAAVEDADATLAEAMAERTVVAAQSSEDTTEESDTVETTSLSVGVNADGKATAKTVTATTQASGNAIAQETTSADQAFRAVRADGRYESAAVSARQDEAAGVETKAAASDTLQTVTVLDSRRYLAPAETSNAANIAASMMGDSEWASAMRTGTEATDTTAGGGRVLNTLKIQMSPIDLGNVTATLRLTGDELTVSLVVESSAAYRKLSEDQNEIVKTLRAQGFSVDQVQITIVSSDKTGSDPSQSGGQGQFSGQQSAQNGAQGGATNSRSQDTFSSSLGNDQSLGVSSDEATAAQSSADGTGSTRSGQLYL